MNRKSNIGNKPPKGSKNNPLSNFTFCFSAFDIFAFGFLILSVGIVLGSLLNWVVIHFR